MATAWPFLQLWAPLISLPWRNSFQTFSTEDTAENPRGFCSYNKIPPLLYLYPAFEPDLSRGCVRKSDLKILIFNGNLYTKRYRVCSKNQLLLKHHVIVSCLLWGMVPRLFSSRPRIVAAASCSVKMLVAAATTRGNTVHQSGAVIFTAIVRLVFFTRLCSRDCVLDLGTPLP